ncbi:MAG TPA: tetratricopeptide repeat protein [Flavobacteriaceae bacterium]|nr:tetratricopeptide repeat protein [Flavobacteriaceae bacterium]
MFKRSNLLYIIILGACLFYLTPFYGQNPTDSLTQLIKKEKDASKKADLLLKRSSTYPKKDSISAFKDIEKAIAIFRKENNGEGLVFAHIERGDVYFHSRDYLKACREDSLALQLSEEIGFDEGRTIAIGKLGWTQFVMGNIEEAEKNITTAVSLEEEFQFEDTDRQVNLYAILGVIKSRMGDHSENIKYLEKSIRLGQDLENKRDLIRVYANYAIALDKVSRSQEAMDMHLKAIRLAEKYQDTVWLMREYNNLAILFKHLDEFEDSFSYYKKSLELATRMERYKSMGLATMNIAVVNQEINIIQNNDSLFLQALEYFEKDNDLYGKSLVYQNYGNYLLQSKRYTEAEEKLLKALEITEATGSLYMRASIFSNLGRLKFEEGELKQAEEYLLEAEKLQSEKEANNQFANDLFLYLKRLYVAKGDFKKAFEYQEKELNVKQKMFAESEKVNSLKLQTAYELEKRDLEMQAEKNRQQKSKLYIFSGGSFIVLVLIFILVVLLQRRKRIRELHKTELVRLQQEHRLLLADSLTEAGQEERRKIANKLHDETGGILSIAKLNLEQLEDKLFGEDNDTEEKLKATKKLLIDASESIRNISHSLMPVALEKYGLKVALQDLIISVNTSKKIKVEEIIEGLEETENWNQQLTLTIYRMVQEVFSNIIKHAQATNILLQIIEHQDSVTIYIEDNGKGMDKNQPKNDGIGLSLLKKNIEYLNGKVEINGRENQGTFILAELPIIYD